MKDYNYLREQADARVNELLRDVAVHQSELGKQKVANDNLERQLNENKARLAQMQRLMLRVGRKETAPLDNVIIEKFVTLKSDILQLVRNHYTKSFPPKGGYGKNASPEIGELQNRAKVAKYLYGRFFYPNVRLFGIEDERNDNLFKRVEDAVLRRHGESEELCEWRASCVRICKMTTTEPDLRYPQHMARLIGQDLDRNCHHPLGSSQREVARSDLESICQKTYSITLLLRETKVDYQWEQNSEDFPSMETNTTDHEIIGTAGPNPTEPHEIHRVVFGGLVRGDRHTGRLKDGQTRLIKASVTIKSPLGP
ncbi:hypothetical protein LTR13_008967 [Exophiala sideris]|nr:hypothetical protein LTR13_008967 [Exophiala sideris]KAK5178919.1 hypothetical protein LTR44_008748 [Eurotiomycetes sp. CCFEE 6388]